MPKSIPYCSNFVRIVFWLGRGFFASDQKTSFTKKFSIGLKNLVQDAQVQNPKFVSPPAIKDVLCSWNDNKLIMSLPAYICILLELLECLNKNENYKIRFQVN